MTSQLPAVIERSTVIAAVEHRGMADLAVRLGWSPTEVNHVLIADFETINAWTSTETARLRSMTPEDVADLGPIHDLEFPKTYYSAGDLASRSSRGEQIVLIAERDDGSFAGYIAGQIQPDGDGYIDFLAVSPSARRTGIGMGLVVAMCQQLVSRSSTQRVCLTVQDGRAPARRLYESLGFRYDASIVGFESMVPLVTR
ncbi:MAG: GNAT family N-acetyltransferase [Acidimicrobiia bacterium]|nr:GNAT family N-acetyltransferase [Acidimicrobiia bacterium]